MATRIDQAEALGVLEGAVDRARANRRLPPKWIKVTTEIGEAPSRTFTAALGTALLAKATDPDIDPLALKSIAKDRRSYSARTLCHSVLVPVSVDEGFDLGATGREPLNNQPFFRYDRIDRMARVHARSKEAHAALVNTLKEVDGLDRRGARAALAAFLRVRLEVAAAKQRVDLRGLAVSPLRLIAMLTDFLAEDAEVGRRAQALVAATFDLCFANVRMGSIHDPSRRFAGDVQAMQGSRVLVAAEVRQKAVSEQEALQFADSLREKAVPLGVVVALHPRQESLDRVTLAAKAESEQGVALIVIEGVAELMHQALMWSDTPLDESLSSLPERLGERLDEIEVAPTTVARLRDRLDSDESG